MRALAAQILNVVAAQRATDNTAKASNSSPRTANLIRSVTVWPAPEDSRQRTRTDLTSPAAERHPFVFCNTNHVQQGKLRNSFTLQQRR
jgi:hypothetical protein